MAKFTLIYFGIEGRGGAIRNMCAIGNVPYEDQLVTFEEWPEMKKTIEYGQLPVIRVGKVEMNQSMDILRYVSKLAGLYPEDPIQALQVDSLCTTIEEVFSNTLYKTMFSKRPKEVIIKERDALLDPKDGELALFLQKLDLRIGFGMSGFLFEFGLSAADLRLFESLCHLSNGVLDGVPETYILDNYKNFDAFRVKIASIDAISKRYNDPNNRYCGTAYTVNWKRKDDDEKSA